MFPIYLSDQAAAWYNSLEAGVRESPDDLLRQFLSRFDGSDAGLAFHNLRQRPTETVSEFFTRYLEGTNDQGMPKPWLISTFVRGLKSDIRRVVSPQHMPTLEEARKAAIRAENSIMEEIEVAVLDEREHMTVPRMREMVSEAVAAAFERYTAKPQVAAYAQDQPGGYNNGPVSHYHSAPVPEASWYQPAHGVNYYPTASQTTPNQGRGKGKFYPNSRNYKFCHICEKEGHVTNRCPHLNEVQNFMSDKKTR